MYKIVLLFFCSLGLFAQEKMQLTYKADVIKDLSQKDAFVSQYIKKGTEQVKELVYTLKINNDESLWFLENSNFYTAAHMGSAIAGKDSYYLNLKTNEFIEQKMFSNEFFIIKKQIPSYNWILIDETKEILGYNCKKAILEEKSMIDGTEKTFIKTAWYCVDLPYKFGPRGYFGLNGLILEFCYNDFITYTCTDIKTADNLPLFILTKPNQGKEVTNEEYSKRINEIMKEKGLYVD